MDNSLLERIVKPSLLLDEDKARANIHSMAEKARQSNVIFRPHFKTHQAREIGSWFRDEGVCNITVSSVDMAEYFVEAGWEDITIAFPVNIRQIQQIQTLAKRFRLSLLVEDVETLNFLGANLKNEVSIWVKVDCGLHRSGIPYDRPELVGELMQTASKFPHLPIVGLLTHAGNTYASHSKEEILHIHYETNQRMRHLRDIQSTPGLKLSIGDTPGCSLVDSFTGVDEIRPGNFVFYDAEQWELGSCHDSQVAVALACPVVSVHPDRNEVVLYGGAVHFSKEIFIHSGKPILGFQVEMNGSGWSNILPECSLVRLSQEHGVLSVPGTRIHTYHPGDIVLIIPAHSCLSAHLMRRYLTLRGKTIEMMPV